MGFLRKILLILAIGFVVSLATAQIASYFLLKPILEREVRRMFQVPVYIEKAGANLFGGSVWMKNVRVKNGAGFKERDILSARTVAVDLNILSLLTHEFSIRRILFKDPQLMLEINEEGEFDGSDFFDRVIDRSEKLVHSERKFVHLVTKYILEKFSIRNGAIKFMDHRSPERNFSLEFISFSLARLVYPPDPEEALPVAIYMNATIPGDSVGKIIVLGRVNPFASKKSFDITGSLKNLPLTQYKNFMTHSPLPVTEGTLQLKIKALCHENQVDIYHQVRLDQLRFSPAELPQGETPLVFGLKSDSVVNFFNNRGAPAEAFEFDFRVAGDLSDPNFDLFSVVGDQMQQAVRNRLTAQMKAVSEKATQMTSVSQAQPKKAI